MPSRGTASTPRRSTHARRSVGAVGAPIIVVTGSLGAGKSTVGRLVAESFERGVHVRMDDFWPLIVRGWVDPNLPAAAHQNHVLGGAAARAAMTFAAGGYAVVLDGFVRPDALPMLGSACKTRGIPLHFAVLRAELATCVARVEQRDGGVSDMDDLVRLHSWYVDLGEFEINVVEASGAPETVAEAVLSAVAAGILRVN